MREIDIAQLAAALAEGATVIDVREPSEYADAHVPGARNIPIGRLTGRLDEFDRTSPVHLVCASGNRSSAMTVVLLAEGFDAVNVMGGTSAWVDAGHPVARGVETGATR